MQNDVLINQLFQRATTTKEELVAVTPTRNRSSIIYPLWNASEMLWRKTAKKFVGRISKSIHMPLTVIVCSTLLRTVTSSSSPCIVE